MGLNPNLEEAMKWRYGRTNRLQSLKRFPEAPRESAYLIASVA